MCRLPTDRCRPRFQLACLRGGGSCEFSGWAQGCRYIIGDLCSHGEAQGVPLLRFASFKQQLRGVNLNEAFGVLNMRNLVKSSSLGLS